MEERFQIIVQVADLIAETLQTSLSFSLEELTGITGNSVLA